MSTVQVTAEHVHAVYTGSVDVGTTAVAAGLVAELTRGVELRSMSDNTGIIYVSTRAGVTAGTDNGHDGFAIEPGTSVFFPAVDLTRVYLISDTADQVVSFLAY